MKSKLERFNRFEWNDKLADKEGKMFEGISKDKLHPSLKGHQIWAEGLKPIFTENRSTIMTSNRPSEDWGKLLSDVP